MHKTIQLFNTIKFLKPIQIYYRVYYFLRRKYRKATGFKYRHSKESNSCILMLHESIRNKHSIYKDGSFVFLNLSKKFDADIDWNYSEYGKLWTYNLAYFEYLHKKEYIKLIYSFIDNIKNITDGMEPFPISLRAVSWIKFLTYHDIQDKKIDDSLYAQYEILLDNLEFHLLGNHLLENGFSLLFGAYYFQDEKLYRVAKKILISELNEQVLDDGAHFELAPMYHQIMLFRILDCCNLLQSNQNIFDTKNYGDTLLSLLKEKAEKMLAWLENITFKNGDIPCFNDSTKGIAPTTQDIIDYAKRLGIEHNNDCFAFGASGYRKVVKKGYECIVDVGDIGPDYIPGHAHADTFTFELHIDTTGQKNIPFIVDSGLSTYETNKRREKERSTSAHNTVEIDNKNSSSVWGAFRVANRAKITHLQENGEEILASHDGYKDKMGILHTRSWKFYNQKIVIKDSLSKKAKAVSRLHFHPDISKDMIKNSIDTKNNKFTLGEYWYANGFNRLQKAYVAKVYFEKELELVIHL